jgi:hypothetical protein
MEGETRSEAGDPARKKERVRMQRAGQRRCCEPESWWVGVSKSAEGGTPSHRHGIRWQAGGRMEHAMVTQSPTMPLQCVIREPGMECSKHTCAPASA